MKLKCEVSWERTQERCRHNKEKERENENGKKKNM